MSDRLELEIDCPNNHNQTVEFSKEEFEEALKSGALAERIIFEAGRLSGFRAEQKADAGPSPAHEGIA